MFYWMVLIFLCILRKSYTINVDEVKEEWREVKIAQGSVRGRMDPSGELYAFYNIPYATTPTGRDKFKAPFRPPTWEEPYEAIDKRVICPQFYFKSIMPSDLNMQENCLIANIFVPNTKEENLSVLVHVHGGGFQVGFGDMVKFTNLMKTKDLIVVTFNYRLGINGFLCLGTKDVPGNAGMKDQVALLRWVQQNIAAFGGNPNDVTIGGGSAGSASVDLLMISKVTEGLFNKVIPESGANTAVFSIQSDPLQAAKDHAMTLNFTDVDNILALEEFYKTLPLELLTATPFIDRADSTFLFSPCVERNTGVEPFLTDSPLNILKTGNYNKVPMLYGFANMEGLLRTMFFELWYVKMNDKFSDFLPADLLFKNENEKEDIAQKIRKFYFEDKPINSDNVLGYVDYFSDVMFTYPTLRAIKLHTENGHDQIYLYEYSFVDDDTPVVPHTSIRGANHCAQSVAIADGKNLLETKEDGISEAYKKMKKTMREIWHNFVKTGTPTPANSTLPTWPPVGKNMSPHMSLGQKMELRGILLEERFKFWDNIYANYYKEPIPPLGGPHIQRTEL